LLGYVDDEGHIVEVVPRRKAEHQRQRHFVLQYLHHLNHAVVAVTPTHPLVSLAATVERDVQMPGLIETDGVYDTTGRETIGKQRVVRVMLAEPRHDFRSLWVEDELAALQSDGCMSGNTPARHDAFDVIKRQMFHPLLPDVAVLAFRLAGRGGIDHQLRQPLVVWSHDVVQIEVAIIDIIVDRVHKNSLQFLFMSPLEKVFNINFIFLFERYCPAYNVIHGV